MPSKHRKQQGIQAYITCANSQPVQLTNMAMSAGSAPDNTQPASEVNKPAMVHQLSAMLENQQASMKEDMAKIIQTTSQSLKASVDALRGDMNLFNKRLTETETRVGENFERITSAEATVKSLDSQNKHLLGRVEDLENRLCRSNLRIVNILEGSETSKEPKQFIAGFLMEFLGEIFTSPPPIDRETRTETRQTWVLTWPERELLLMASSRSCTEKASASDCYIRRVCVSPLMENLLTSTPLRKRRPFTNGALQANLGMTLWELNCVISCVDVRAHTSRVPIQTLVTYTH